MARRKQQRKEREPLKKRDPRAGWAGAARAVKASGEEDRPRSAAELAALARLGVTPEELDAAPQITPLLKMAVGAVCGRSCRPCASRRTA